MNYETGYKSLMENLLDMVIEQQAKLGYMKETIRLYYPLASINNFLSTDADIEGMKEILSGFCDYAKEAYGEVKTSNVKDRFCFILSDSISEYVHEHLDPQEFIVKLVKLVSDHDTTLDDIYKLFDEQEDSYTVEQMDNGEFDVAVRFIDSKDKYVYCFKNEGCHLTYHRFAQADYEDFGF